MATFTPADLHRYLTRLQFPNLPSTTPFTPPPPSLSTLRTLLYCHLTTIPFENLSFHYYPSLRAHPIPSLAPSDLLHKFLGTTPSSSVPTGLRGGYCMEITTLFATCLRTLGYTLHIAGGRVHIPVPTPSGEKWGGWNHVAIVVHLGDQGRYLVDVGFGGNGPVQPVLLEDGAQVKGLGSMKHRVVKRVDETGRGLDAGWVFQWGEWAADGEDKLWCWKDGYWFFPNMEFLPADLRVMNFSTMDPEKSIFASFLFCVRNLRAEEVRKLVNGGMEMEGVDEGELEMGIEGTPQGKVVVVDGKLKVRLGDRLNVVKKFDTEAERVEALKEWFRVEVEVEAMRGYKLEIRESKKKPTEGDGESPKMLGEMMPF